jgi:hypothetical protein
MSASSDRKKRMEAISSGTDRKTLAQLEEEKKQRKSRRQWTFGTIVIVLLISAILVLNSNLFFTGVTAVQVGDVSYNTAQYDYYFKVQYMQFYQNYGSYASLFGLDTSKPLKDQTCSMLEDGGTWYDYFQQQTLQYMTQITALSEYAKKNNITLDDTEKANIDTQMQTYASQATQAGYSSTKNYLISAFGRGSSEELVRGELERYALAYKAYNTVSDSYKFTDAELETYYQQNKDSLDLFDYDYYLVQADKVTTASGTDVSATDASATNTSATDTAASSAVTKETMAAAKTKADAIAASIKSGKDFDTAAAAVVDGAAATVQSGTAGSGVTDVYADWLKDSSRKAGDVTVVESSDTGYFVVEFLGRSDNHYNMQQARHILIKAVASDDGTYTDDAKATAKASAQKIYDEWKSGVATEDSFASLATEYSEDTGSKSNGGLYDSIYKNEMVTAFNDFVFAPERKAGDTTLIYGESSEYAGYHIVYYVGQGDLYSNYLAKTAMVNAKMQTWQTDLTKNYTAVTKFAIRFESVG